MQSDDIRIERVTDPVDFPELARVTDLALRPDGFYAFVERYGTQSIYEEMVENLHGVIKDPNSAVFKAVMTYIEENGKVNKTIVGVAQWYVGYIKLPKTDPFASKPTSLGAGEEGNTAIGLASSDTTGIAAGATPAVVKTVKPGLDPNAELRRKTGNEYVAAIRGKKHVYLRRMTVHPEHQRKGIGRKMLQWGIDVADRENIVGWLFSRPAGSRLYEKAGWKAIASTEVNVPDIDVPPIVSMLRLPQSLPPGS